MPVSASASPTQQVAASRSRNCCFFLLVHPPLRTRRTCTRPHGCRSIPCFSRPSAPSSSAAKPPTVSSGRAPSPAESISPSPILPKTPAPNPLPLARGGAPTSPPACGRALQPPLPRAGGAGGGSVPPFSLPFQGRGVSAQRSCAGAPRRPPQPRTRKAAAPICATRPEPPQKSKRTKPPGSAPPNPPHVPSLSVLW